ncbi:MAG: CoA transferase [Alphaproteobacteria bacterium]|nr:CoA transferase [Alphaproteobacteria bacterium]
MNPTPATSQRHLSEPDLPLRGVRVLEFVHTVMGPSCGLVLADLGADVIKVEAVTGDVTRRLTASGAGYWSMFNRNKASIAVDLKSEDGLEIARRLVATADVMVENFGPGTIDRLGLGWNNVSRRNPRLIFCSLKGFLAGPYENRMALDEVTQMMGGLAYMTGLPGRPLRAGASVIDVLGGTFGAIAILAALHARNRDGKGRFVKSALFESTTYLVGQHMAYLAVTGKAMPPMAVRLSAWAVYDVFQTQDGVQVFLGLVTDNNWIRFCNEFGLVEFLEDATLKTNIQRVHARERTMPVITAIFASSNAHEIMARLEKAQLPFAPINRPEDLIDDPHLVRSGQMHELETAEGKPVRVPGLPIEYSGLKLPKRRGLPKIGQDTHAILLALGYDEPAIARLRAASVISGP